MLGSSNYEEEEKKLKSRKKKICVTKLGESLILGKNFKRCENRWLIEWHLDRTVVTKREKQNKNHVLDSTNQICYIFSKISKQKVV